MEYSVWLEESLLSKYHVLPSVFDHKLGLRGYNAVLVVS